MSSNGAVDVHAHYLPPFYAAAMHEREMWFVAGLPVPEWTPALALEFMDAHGVAAQVLSISDPGVEFVQETFRPKGVATPKLPSVKIGASEGCVVRPPGLYPTVRARGGPAIPEIHVADGSAGRGFVSLEQDIGNLPIE